MESSIWHTVGALCHRYPRVLPCWHLITRMNQTFWDLQGAHSCAWGDTQVNGDYNKMSWKSFRKEGVASVRVLLRYFFTEFPRHLSRSWLGVSLLKMVFSWPVGLRWLGVVPGTEGLLVRAHGGSRAQSPVKSRQEAAD